MATTLTLKERYAQYKVDRKAKKEKRDKERKVEEDRLRKETLDAEYARDDAKKAKKAKKDADKEAKEVEKIKKSNAKGLKKWDKKRAKDAKKAKRKADADARTAEYQKQAKEKKDKKEAKTQERMRATEEAGLATRKKLEEDKAWRAKKREESKKRSEEGKAERAEKREGRKAWWKKVKGNIPGTQRWLDANKAKGELRDAKQAKKVQDRLTAETDEKARIKARDEYVAMRDKRDIEDKRKFDEKMDKEAKSMSTIAKNKDIQAKEKARRIAETDKVIQDDADKKLLEKTATENAEAVAKNQAERKVREEAEAVAKTDLDKRYTEQKAKGEFVDKDVQAQHEEALRKADEYMASTKKQEKKDFLGKPPKDTKNQYIESKYKGLTDEPGTVEETDKKTFDPRQVKQEIADKAPANSAPATTPGETVAGYDVTAQPPEEQKPGFFEKGGTGGKIAKGAFNVGAMGVGAVGAVAGYGYGKAKEQYMKSKAKGAEAERYAQYGDVVGGQGQFQTWDDYNNFVDKGSGKQKNFSSVTGEYYETKADQDSGETKHYKRVAEQEQRKNTDNYNTALQSYVKDKGSVPMEDLYVMGVLAGKTDEVLKHFSETDVDMKKKMEQKMYKLAETYMTEGENMSEQDLNSFKNLLMTFGKGKAITQEDTFDISVEQSSRINPETEEPETFYEQIMSIGEGASKVVVKVEINEQAFSVLHAQQTKKFNKKKKTTKTKQDDNLFE